MKKIIYLIVLVFVISGCSTVNSINKGYGRINPNDGISKREAKRIAQKCLLEASSKRDFKISSPIILDNGKTYRHQNYWFVSFKKRLLVSDATSYLVVIDKRNGDIVYSEKKYPSTVRGYWWIFHLEQKEYPWHNKKLIELSKR